MVQVVLLLSNGHVEDVNISLTSKKLETSIEKLFTDAFVSKYIKNKGKGKIKIIHTWNIEDYCIYAYGYNKGDQENNHELPPPVSDSEIFGDILVAKTNHKKQILGMNTENYEEIYNNLFTNENLGDGDSDNEDQDNEEYDDEIEVESDDEVSDFDCVSVESDDDEFGEETLDEDNLDINFTEEDTLENDNIEETLEETVKKNENRLKNIELFYNLVKNKDTADIIENSIFKFACDESIKRKILSKWNNPLFKKIYFNKSRSLYANLKKDSYIKNTDLIKKISKGKLDIVNIASMTHQELFPKHWKTLLDAMYKKDKFNYESKPEAMTDQFKCGRCKKRECTYYEMQTRSADEAMTIFVTCINCGNRWKQ